LFGNTGNVDEKPMVKMHQILVFALLLLLRAGMARIIERMAAVTAGRLPGQCAWVLLRD
jgi:hypothetical protein